MPPSARRDAVEPAKVRPMTAEEFQIWSERAVTSYAHDVARATGESGEATRERAEQQLSQLLPNGVHTERAWLLMVLDERGAAAGTLWVRADPDRVAGAYVQDIEVYESHRGRGLGRAAMLAAERVARDAGCTELGLSVFGFNATARHLYDSLGYRVVITRMAKALVDAPSASTATI
jgi:ribosomal protein S18 acetylase RimI-like enzyme